MRHLRIWTSVVAAACLCMGAGPASASDYKSNIANPKAKAPAPTAAPQASPQTSKPHTEAAPSPQAHAAHGMAHNDSAASAAQTSGGRSAYRSNIAGNPGYVGDRQQPEPTLEELAEGIDWGVATTHGKYRGRRTNYWRELALSGDPSAYDQLIAALQGYPSPEKAIGVAVYGIVQDKKTGEEVAGYVDAPNAPRVKPNVILTRRDAAEALGLLGDQRAVQALEDALNDPDFLVRQNAALSLVHLRQRMH